MSHWIWPLMVFILACMALDMLSDLLLKEQAEDDAHAWSFVLWLFILASAVALAFLFIREAIR
jgi:uncharacterized membrane protein YhaH (DUF805 family)